MAKYNNDIVPELAPRAGNFITRAIGSLMLKVLGWKMVGSLPNEKKLIIIGAPHTSNLDGFLASGGPGYDLYDLPFSAHLYFHSVNLDAPGLNHAASLPALRR